MHSWNFRSRVEEKLFLPQKHIVTWVSIHVEKLLLWSLRGERFQRTKTQRFCNKFDVTVVVSIEVQKLKLREHKKKVLPLSHQSKIPFLFVIILNSTLNTVKASTVVTQTSIEEVFSLYLCFSCSVNSRKLNSRMFKNFLSLFHWTRRKFAFRLMPFAKKLLPQSYQSEEKKKFFFYCTTARLLLQQLSFSYLWRRKEKARES